MACTPHQVHWDFVNVNSTPFWTVRRPEQPRNWQRWAERGRNPSTAPKRPEKGPQMDQKSTEKQAGKGRCMAEGARKSLQRLGKGRKGETAIEVVRQWPQTPRKSPKQTGNDQNSQNHQKKPGNHQKRPEKEPQRPGNQQNGQTIAPHPVNHQKSKNLTRCAKKGVWGTYFFLPIRDPKRTEDTEKWIFPVLGAVLGETSADHLWSDVT